MAISAFVVGAAAGAQVTPENSNAAHMATTTHDEVVALVQQIKKLTASQNI